MNKKIFLAVIILVVVLSCTATFIKVKSSDNTKIDSSKDNDSLGVDLGSSIRFDLNKKDSVK